MQESNLLHQIGRGHQVVSPAGLRVLSNPIPRFENLRTSQRAGKKFFAFASYPR